MAFFGLTALGLQNPCSVSSDTIIHFHIFTEKDFRLAFERQKRKSSFDGLSIKRSQIPALMEDVYRGQVPTSELQLLTRWVDKFRKGDNIYWHELQDAVRAAREEAELVMKKNETEVGPACETHSWTSYNENTRKCSATKRAPPEKYICPLTAQQEVDKKWLTSRWGWAFCVYLLHCYIDWLGSTGVWPQEGQDIQCRDTIRL